MTAKFLVSIAACFACLAILWIIARMMQTPVKFGRSSTGYVIIWLTGAEPRLEQTLNGLLWLNDNGILRCRIIITGTELDEETRFVAGAMAEDHGCITFVEKGELPEWMKTNC